MPNKIIFKKKIENFNKKISIPGDKSLSIRWVLISSLSNGVSTAQNLLMSQDVLATIQAVKKLGVKVVLNNQTSNDELKDLVKDLMKKVERLEREKFNKTFKQN